MVSRPLLRATALLGFVLPPLLAAAEAPTDPRAILQDLRAFATTGSVLHVAAHPDDENTELITWLSRGRGYRTAYLSLTRGDGGQNEQGPDFDEKLGVLRTQELLAGRRLDGGRQFFTRAIDFGYSKTPEETLRFWDRTQVLSDVVRIVRQFRPDVIVTRFPIPPGSGGHGHHTASGILAVEAFKLAADPSAFPEQLAEGLTPWQPRRVLWNSFRIGAIGPGSLDLPVHRQDIAGLDPVTGEEFGLIAARSRALHKTQGLATFINRARTGPNEQSFMLLAGDAVTTGDLMDGIDTTWNRLPGGAEIGRRAQELIAGFNPADPAASVPAILALRHQLAALPTDPVIADKRAQLDRILAAALGLRVETTLAHAEVVPGEAVQLAVRASQQAPNASVRLLAVRSPTAPGLQAGWTAAPTLAAGQAFTGTLRGPLPEDLPLTQPYWLRAEGQAGISRVDDPALIGRAENPPAVPLEFVFSVNGAELVVADEPVQIIPGAPEAQARRRLTVVAPIAVRFLHDVALFRPGHTATVTVELTPNRPGLAGVLRLQGAGDWRVATPDQPFRLGAPGEPLRLDFEVTAPDRPDRIRLTAEARVGGRAAGAEIRTLRYAHLPVQVLQRTPRAIAVSLDVDTRSRTVGYLPGAGDSTAEALAQLGCTVRVLAGADLTPERLAGLDAVVIGVRAFNERDDLKDHLPGLFAWVEQGGTVVAQYNRPAGALPPLGPYALSLAGSAPPLRVTDETAPVTFLAPDHPVLNTPNRITADDFAGWVQERGAYFPSSWDEARYTPILAMSDPGETQPPSSLLIARHGKGHYAYTSLAFFRQLPAGVPGAYRLLANLISLRP